MGEYRAEEELKTKGGDKDAEGVQLKNYCSTPDSTKQKLTPLPPLLEFEVPSDGIEKNEQFVRWFLETKILDVMKHLTGNGDVNR